MIMDRMTCVWEETKEFGFNNIIISRILMDNATGVQYLVVKAGLNDGGVSVTPLLNKDGGILAVPPYNRQSQ